MFVEDYGWHVELTIGQKDTVTGPLESLLDEILPIDTWSIKLCRAGILVLHCRSFTKIALQTIGSKVFSRQTGSNSKVVRELEFNHWTAGLGDGLNSVRCGAVTDEMSVRQVLSRIRGHLKTQDKDYFPEYVH